MEDFTAYAVGLCYASVCTSLTDEQATDRLNAEYPTGVGRWSIADESFAGGEPNPSPCDMDDSEDRRHILFSC